MKFSTKLSLLITIKFLVIFCAMSYLAYVSTTGIVEQNVRERLEGQAFQIIDKIDRMLFERFEDMGVLATDPVVTSRASTPQQIKQRLREHQKNYRIYSSLSFFNMNRVRIADTSGKQIGEQHALTDYWKEIADGKDMVMAITESQTTKQVVIHFVAAVRDRQGRRIGAVASQLPLESIHRIAEQTSRSGLINERVRVELLDMNGLILYSSYHGQGKLREQSSDWENIIELLMQGGSVGSARHAFQGEEEITAFAREQGFDTFKGNGRVLTLCVPVKTAFAATNRQAIKLIAFFLAFGVVAIVITFLVSRAATKPLNELGRAAAELGKGKRDVSLTVRSNDEIGQLARAFNTMARDLEESENKYKELVELLPQVVYETDIVGKFTFVNHYALHMFGYTQEEITNGITMLEAVIPEDHARIMQNMSKVLDGEQIENAEYTVLRKDKSTFPFLAFVVPVKREGKVVGTRGIGIDITERKRIEQEQQKFVSLIENSSDFIGIAGLDGKVVYLNKAGKVLVGLECDDEAITAKSLFDFVFPEDIHKVETSMLPSGFWQGEFRLRHFKTGLEIPVEFTEYSVRDLKTGEPIAYAALGRDITERKRAEDALRASEELYRSVVDNVGIGIALISPTMEILSLNRQMKEWSPAIDVSQRPICFRSFNRPPREEICTYCPTTKTLKDGQVHVSVTETPTAGGIMNYRVTSSPLKDSEGNVIAAIELVEDVTERKRWENEIRRLNQELKIRVEERTKQLLDTQDALVRKEKLATLGQLVGTVGHELRNPLGVMNNAVYFLQTVLTDANETTKEYLGIIKREIEGAERIVSDLLDAVRTRPPHPQLVAAENLIRMSLEKCSIPEHVTVEVLSATQRSVLIDPIQMKQAFINLINNGVEAMAEGGTLKITAEEGKLAKLVKFTFTDEGAGITPENITKLFQPLFTTKARGIGLGLIVVKNLTEANGGKVDVESEPGRGTTFTITLSADNGKDKQDASVSRE